MSVCWIIKFIRSSYAAAVVVDEVANDKDQYDINLATKVIEKVSANTIDLELR